MNVALIVAMVLVVILAVWLTIQIQAIRRKVDAVPDDGNVVAVLRAMDDRSKSNAELIQTLTSRVSEIEGRLPYAISYVGVVAYDAFGNITGNQSRSIALLSQRGDGLVVTLLKARDETVFYAKQIADGKGVEELSPEELAAVNRALGR
jgi:hypothetical protein